MSTSLDCRTAASRLGANGGLLSGGPGTLRPPSTATVLLWQAGRELAWLEGGERARRLVLNFNAARRNADRLPASVTWLRWANRQEQPHECRGQAAPSLRR